MGCRTNQRIIALGYLLQLLVQRHQGLFIFFMKSVLSTKVGEGKGDCGSGVFIAEEADGVRDIINVDMQTHVEDL